MRVRHNSSHPFFNLCFLISISLDLPSYPTFQCFSSPRSGCVQAVKAALGEVAGVNGTVEVDLDSTMATIPGSPDLQEVKESLEDFGFEFGGKELTFNVGGMTCECALSLFLVLVS